MKKIIVVLGMHRSGTSALTRGLETLGVSLGENLMPAAEGNNNKGFWEDLEVVALNDALLSALGMNWHSLGSLHSRHDWTALLAGPLAARAESYLLAQTKRFALFGIKDPRMARLLPFWKEIFHRCRLEPFFLITNRNPLSVCRSLQKRDGFLFGKSAYLWLEHVLSALMETQGYRRLVVDFDHLLAEPLGQIQRIADAAQLAILGDEELRLYLAGFLETDLRHFLSSSEEVEASLDLTNEIAAVYRLLEKVADDEVDLENAEIRSQIESIASGFRETGASYRLIIAQNNCFDSLVEQVVLQRKWLDEQQKATQVLDETLTANQHKHAQRACSLSEIQQSNSWRITAPLRVLAKWLRNASRQRRTYFSILAKRIYHWLPSTLREPTLRFLYSHFGLLFHGMGHYETWRVALPHSHGQSRMFAYRYVKPLRTEDTNLLLMQFEQQPLISIITPVYGVEPKFLQALIESVKLQWYENWELILVEDAGPNPATRRFLAAINDQRIKVTLCDRNGGISAASNIALAQASGEYVAFLDHDDELTPDALFEIVKAINLHAPDFIYSDEDIIDEVGNCRAPFFKPDWSPDTLMSIMYTCHLSCIRKTLIDEVGGLQGEFDGAQDYDLALRVTERTQRVHHISKVLYHWRSLPSSTASGLNAKPYAAEATYQLKRRALERRELLGSVESVQEMPGQFRVNYLPVGTPLVSIIIIANGISRSRKCIDSLISRTRYFNFEIVLVISQAAKLVENSFFSDLKSDPRIFFISQSEITGRNTARNMAVRESRGEYLLFFSDSNEPVNVDWLERMLGFAQLKHVGAVGAKVVTSGLKKIHHCGMVNTGEGPVSAFVGSPAFAPLCNGMNILEWNWPSVAGECLMLSRTKFVAIAGFDETFSDTFQDTDLCWRLSDAGLHTVNCNAVVLERQVGPEYGGPRIAESVTEDGLHLLYSKHPVRKLAGHCLL